MRTPRSWEVIVIFVLFLVLSLILGRDTEILAIPSPDDDAFYARKSLSLFGTWSDRATIKEIGSPVFFALVRTLGLPLRFAFGLAYAFALFLLWWELRRWPFPRWMALCAALLPMFMPSQYLVFTRSTSDPLSVILTVCLLTSCIAMFRSKAGWTSVVCAGLTASAIWLNRPEGILGIFPVLFTIALLKFMTRREPASLHPGGLAMRLGTVFGMLTLTMLSINALNRKYYDLPAATIFKAQPFVRALNLLCSIDDGETPERGRPVSQRALNLAFENSPTMASTQTYWKNNTGGRGWSSVNFKEYSPADGSVDGGHFHFAFRGSGAELAGPNPGAQFRFFQKIAEELDSAIHRGALPRRSTPIHELGPTFSIFSPLLWSSVWQTGQLIFSGRGPIGQSEDTASEEHKRMIDLACTRRNRPISEEHRKIWAALDAAGAKWSAVMVWSGVAGFLAFFMVFIRRKRHCALWKALMGITLISASILLPRWFLLAAIAANRFPTHEPRLIMPGSVVAWVWVALALGAAVLCLAKSAPEKDLPADTPQ